MEGKEKVSIKSKIFEIVILSIFFMAIGLGSIFLYLGMRLVQYSIFITIGVYLIILALSIGSFLISRWLSKITNTVFSYSSKMFENSRDFQLAAIGGLFVALILFTVELIMNLVYYGLTLIGNLSNPVYRIIIISSKYTIGIVIIVVILYILYKHHTKEK